MQIVLAPVLNTKAHVYLDDIIIFSNSFSEHMKDLEQTVALIESAGLKISPGKCDFARDSLNYLGHTVSSEGISVTADKTHAIGGMAQPHTVKQVRSFLDAVGFYRRFIPHCSEIAAPLTALTRKKQDLNGLQRVLRHLKN